MEWPDGRSANPSALPYSSLTHKRAKILVGRYEQERVENISNDRLLDNRRTTRRDAPHQDTIREA